jgi:hypothetical protein
MEAPRLRALFLASVGCAAAARAGAADGGGRGGGGRRERRRPGGAPARAGVAGGGCGGAGGASGAAALGAGARTDAPIAGAGGAPAATAERRRPTGPIALPLVVTGLLPAQGWFADPSLMAEFRPGSMLIQQGSERERAVRGAAAGRAGALPADHRTRRRRARRGAGQRLGGRLLPAPARHDHAEVMPAMRAGEPNWGLEPGAASGAGATKISF